MVASDRSTDAWGRRTGCSVATLGHRASCHQPRAHDPTPARWVSATHQSRMGGLLPPLGPVLLGQQLAQPGMLVVHLLPFLSWLTLPWWQRSLL
jgi:hypothetical protein